jgi:multiple sugar transport system permease protein
MKPSYEDMSIRHSKLQRAEAVQGYLFISPWIVGFVVFAAGPVIVSLALSFCKWDVLTPAEFVGLKNYIKMTEDPLVRKSLLNTLYYASAAIPLGMVGALGTALLLNQKLKGMRLFRTLFYVPSVTSGVATFLLWSWIFNPEIGLLNRCLVPVCPFISTSANYAAWLWPFAFVAVAVLVVRQLTLRENSYVRLVVTYSLALVAGMAAIVAWWCVFRGISGAFDVLAAKPPQWLASRDWAMPALIIMSLWGVGGGMLIYLAGLQGIPEELYEAAEIDGANPLQKFRKITIPLLSPTIFFNLIMSIIGSFQVFGAAFVMTGGGPSNATLFYVLYLFQNAFMYFRMGYAAAMAWLLFLIILTLTLIQFKIAPRWVHYQ